MSSKQHFLLTAKARTLSVCQVKEMTEQDMRSACSRNCVGEQARKWLAHYLIRICKQWRCRDCGHTFTVTSGTIFAFHKLPLKVYLAAIAIYTNAVKGISALQLGCDLGVQYKTAFVLAHKIRESLMEQREFGQLDGEVHIDGAYVNGHIRPKNKKSERIDRRLAEHQKPNKRCVFVMRQKCEEMAGNRKALTFVLKSENQADVVNLADRFITRQSVICGDESTAYDLLPGKFETSRVNHQLEYRADDGTTNNLAESYFSRFRRMQYGQTHKFGNLYLPITPMKPLTARIPAAGTTAKSSRTS